MELESLFFGRQARRSDLLSDLNPRDDLESLAFILLYLLRGSLPWHKLCRAGTAVTRITQIRSKLLSWNGARLGEGYSSAFGKLLDYARHLGFDEPIDYEGFRSDFKKLRDSKVQTNRNVGPGKTFTSLSPEASPIAELTGLRPSITKKFPAAAGDLVLVQIDMRTSVEGYTFREDNSCYRPDPSLSGGSWKAPFRPALILSRKAQEGGRCSFWLIPLTKRTPKGAISLKGIGVDDLPESLSKLSAYVFPRAIEIYTLPSHVLLQNFSNTLTLTRSPCRRRCPRDGSYPAPPSKIYGASWIANFSSLITRRQRTVTPTSVMRCVCSCSTRFFTPTFFPWIHLHIPKLIGQVSEVGLMNA